MDHSFSEHEKRFILAEMLKASQVEIAAVVEFIKSRHIYPNWLEMELPRGRNMNQCLQAVGNMGIEAPPPALSQHHSQFRQYGSQQPPAQQLPQQPLQQQVQPQQQHYRQQHIPQHRQHQQYPQESPLPLSKPPSATAKRRPSTDPGEHPSKRMAAASAEAMHPVTQPQPQPQPRTIQPRPANAPLPNSPSFTATAPPVARSLPKKRGRPSRADKDAQARAAGNYPLAYIAPASTVPMQIEGQRPSYQPTSARSTPEGRVSNADTREQQGRMRQSTDRSPQPGREPYSAPSEALPDSSKPEPEHKGLPSPKEPPVDPAAPAATPRTSPPIAATPQPSSRLAVADLLKSAGSAVITTGV